MAAGLGVTSWSFRIPPSTDYRTLDDAFHESLVERFSGEPSSVKERSDDRSNDLRSAPVSRQFPPFLRALNHQAKSSRHFLVHTGM